MAPPCTGRNSEKKARLLLVDDHRGLLDRTAEILSGPFDIAGTATDGMAAIAAARRLQPDAIVLDINMPGLDGFRTLDALQEIGVRAPVVFLSMLDSREEVGEAFKRGGRGYVVKSHMGRDLEPALDHALNGRRFMPSLIAVADQAPERGHAIHLDGEDEGGSTELVELFEHAIARGDATCVIAPAAVRQTLAARFDGHPRFRATDSTEALNRLMRNGRPDERTMLDIALELDDYRITAAGTTSRLTIFGKMAGTLSAQGDPNGALAIERAWDRLTKDMPFLTICGYSSGCFHHAHDEHFSGVCAAHASVSHASNL